MTHPVPPQLQDKRNVERELIRRKGLREFIRRSWHVLEPKTPYVHNWHIDIVADHVQAFYEGKIQKLLINIPPRTLKSIICSVMSPAWNWTERPHFRSIHVSYSQTLSLNDSVRCRRLIESPWYQSLWGNMFQLTTDQNTKSKFENDMTGTRTATSVGGTVTGEGGDANICDDLINVLDASSKAALKEASDFFWETLQSRVNDPKQDRFLIIAQRVNVEDVPGEILERCPKEYVHINLPRIRVQARKIFDTKPSPIGFEDPRKEGELLEPDRFPMNKVEQRKKDLGTYAFEAQEQQDPVSREGGIIKLAWLNKNRFKGPLNLETLRSRKPVAILQSYDCASKPEEHNDPTVEMTLGIFPDHVELWHVWSERVEFPDGQRHIKDAFASWQPNDVLIEDKDAGQQHIQQIRRDVAEGKCARIPITAMDPGKLDKFTRMDAETPYIEAGGLWLPEDAPWLQYVIEKLTTFSAQTKKGDDEVDCLSQALKYVREKNYGRRLWLMGPGGDTQASPHKIN